MAREASDERGTRSEDYSRTYYNDAHLGGYDNYTWDNEEWRQFFRMVADRVVAATNPASVLDVGCARGLLVQALCEKGVDAYGIDLSDHAIESAHPDVRERLRVASATLPFDSKYGLVTCIEVLEHLSPADAQLAIDNMTSATDLILFSSSPGDHDEATHINTHASDQWAAWFAERGFHRRIDVDLSFLTPWAVLFERSDLTTRAVIQRYEQQYARLNGELLEKRSALLEAHRRIQTLNDELQGVPRSPEQAELVRQWEAEVLEARHELLVSRDHSVGTQAEIGRLNRDLMAVTERLQAAESQVVRLTRRRDKVTERLTASRQRARAAQQRVVVLRRRVAELEAEVSGLRRSPVRRVLRRLRGSGR